MLGVPSAVTVFSRVDATFAPLQSLINFLSGEAVLDSLPAEGSNPHGLAGNVMPSEVACRAVALAKAGGISQFFWEPTNELTFSNIQRPTSNV